MCNNNLWLIIIVWFLFSGNGCGNGCGNGGAQETTIGGCGCHNDCGCHTDSVRVVGNGCC